ncbi:hypothetical protein BU26DRAFT_36970 [Trematosphaeria pertusa]|uniref:Uncharacterized protein n=1 Tax=Trematosphaeria pertusa TaxID=390896 RepID=A0A6A6J455_9PLEO|nr:uncharacterized protein BU26DRAFT_36970 [Trematosphaeria pertusa]KAF2257137.1 hypothetical protein BU26DRAFT_36970 [Trematosphaeria pertusa]
MRNLPFAWQTVELRWLVMPREPRRRHGAEKKGSLHVTLRSSPRRARETRNRTNVSAHQFASLPNLYSFLFGRLSYFIACPHWSTVEFSLTLGYVISVRPHTQVQSLRRARFSFVIDGAPAHACACAVGCRARAYNRPQAALRTEDLRRTRAPPWTLPRQQGSTHENSTTSNESLALRFCVSENQAQ